MFCRLGNLNTIESIRSENLLTFVGNHIVGPLERVNDNLLLMIGIGTCSSAGSQCCERSN